MKQIYIVSILVVIFSIIMGVLNYRTHQAVKKDIENLEGFLVAVSTQPDGSNLYQVYVNQLKK